ncbi:MAG: phosphoethanolamine--lipid A transferase [Colwellia sp.]|nr:phosphoethanolamine--lipid A transferase [Colwellia sp.]
MITALQKLKTSALSINQLLVITASYFTLVFNYPFLRGFIEAILALEEFSLFFLLSVPILLCSLLIILLSTVSSKYLVKPLLITLTLVSSLVFYGSVQYGIVFDYGMIENSVESNKAEVFSYLNVEFIVYFVLFGITPSWFIYQAKINEQCFLAALITRIKLLSLAIITILLIALFYYQDYASVGRNNSHLKKFIVPSQFLSSGLKYFKHNYFDEKLTFITLDETPVDNTPNKQEVIVLVVGETARAKNFSANGYEKPTNSHSQKYQPVSFKNMFSCGTATAVSVPCMFSSLTRENFDRRKADHQQNLLDVISLAGVDVLWIDNNGCKNVCDRVPTITLDVNQDNSLCDGEYCQDEALLAPLKDKLAHLSKNKTVIVLHMMGSHGPTYFKRYPDQHKKFKPDCNRSDIQNCSQNELTNSYDNTIAYSDFVLSQVIAQLQNLPSNINKSMIYISDHGESLGESGVYLHGFPYAFSPKEQRHIPMLVWMSAHQQSNQQEFQQGFQPKGQKNSAKACLKRLADNNSYSHDNLYHSMLGLLAISTSTYQKDLDIFSKCPRSVNNP